jgi:hypothetical protein
MRSKYLSGKVRVTTKDESIIALKRVIFLMRKTDNVQHSDMARYVGFMPDSGGFVEDFEECPLDFNGESISCRVETEFVKDELDKMLLDPTWYKCQVETEGEWNNKQKYWLFQIVDTNDNIIPFEGMSGFLKWEPCTKDEAYILMLKEFEGNNG